MNHVEEDQLYSLIDRIDVGGDDRRGEEEDVREEQGFDNGMMSEEQKRSLGRYQKNAEWMAEVFSEAEGAQQLFDEFSGELLMGGERLAGGFLTERSIRCF
eukprot:TRINITY_DN1519_c1_g1_i8.p2 TRINITY_DN1519_c1_g1~~TRINITY_DN1519_c1_g1_i8.p2  ORF type:complete len:101 (+),score=22.23 TRINITY_DN1519_c1_g1_i8:333-635(+)